MRANIETLRWVDFSDAMEVPRNEKDAWLASMLKGEWTGTRFTASGDTIIVVNRSADGGYSIYEAKIQRAVIL